RGASIQVTLSAGSQAGTWKVVVSLPGVQPETFDNIGLGLTANALWVAIAAAINNGIANFTASNIIIATAGASTAAPVAGTTSLTGGNDGVGTITSTVLLGVDTTPRKGMYGLRSTGAA